MNFFAQDTTPGVRVRSPGFMQDFVDTVPVQRPVDIDLSAIRSEGYVIQHPRRPLGLDQQGRYPWATPLEIEDEDRRLGWGAILPVLVAGLAVAFCAGLVLLLK